MQCQRPRETTIEFYLQNLASGPDATVFPVTGLKGTSVFHLILAPFSPLTIPCITETLSKISTQVGRAQGILVASALSGSNVHVSVSIAFTNGDTMVACLEIQGISRQYERYKELSVVAGTGTFRYARDLATLETIFHDDMTSYSVVRRTIRLLLNTS
ncbi:dirigent protein 2-like [Pyrus communis]|uniref:dirigent protein 2-like n=1 Tax=Pyrus communis TaxID=23211 RepID=UPI0035C0007B